MKTKRIVSLLLAVFTIMSALVLTTGATDAEGEKVYEYTYNTTNTKPTIDYIAGVTIPEEEGVNGVAVNTADKKLAKMDLRLAKDGYLLYVDAYSGEIAVVCEETGESLFSNPYNIGSSNSANTADIREQIMSQLVVYYQDLSTGSNDTYYSYEWCASLGQVDVKNIKNGIRVEYAIGREEARMLVPGAVKKETFEAKILNPLAELFADEGGVDAYKYKKIREWYRFYDKDSMDIPEDVMRKYPALKKMALYVLDANITGPKKALLEQDIKTYCPEYSYEDLDADHLEAEFESEDKDPPLFKMALEYTLDEYGLQVRLPANGIRFNESLYRLEKIEVLPYMGAGCNYNPGYTFYPDGSGAIFDFETIQKLGMPVTIGSNVYGEDYAYHSITMKHEETIRYPVFGLRETQTFKVAAQAPGAPAPVITPNSDGEYEKDRGFVAIVEEGDALMKLEVNHAGKTNVYNTVKMSIFPRPKDTYDVADAITVGGNTTWTVVSSRKYTGSYKVRYIMLTDPDVAAAKGITDYYDCTYVGMAKAYREYLEDKGVLTQLTADDVKSDIPLYIETFGAVETTERVLSVPVKTMAPLTSFENIKTMYADLSAEGITNVNFVLNGYTKKGMSHPAVPYHLKWEKAVGGNKGFEELVAYAKEKDFGIYPDVDFVFISGDGLFDGVTLKKHAVKTIDNRYTSKRVYSATKQTFISYYELAISPAYFNRFYQKFTQNYLKYDPIGISVSTLGTYLNSDFDEDEPYNRGDAKDFTMEAFEYLDNNYGKVMTSGGNSFSWKYVDYIRDVALDSSRFAQSAASVPFLGMVLHGYVQIAGTPINMEGNTDYAFLKAIENGASLNFILSYQNTDILKEDVVLNQYYSVRYDIWFNDLVAMYTELNAALKDVQTSLIVDHQFIIGERVPDEDELLADSMAALEEAIRIETELREEKTKEEQKKLLEARKGIYKALEDITTWYNGKSDGKGGTTGGTLNHVNTILGYKIAERIKAYEERVYLDSIIALEEEIKAIEKEIETLNNTVKTTEEEIAALENLDEELAALQADLKKLNDELAALNAANPVDSAAVTAKQKDITKKENEITKKQREVDKQAEDLEAANKTLAETKATLAEKQAALDAKKAEFEPLVPIRDAINAVNNIKTYNKDLTKLESDLVKLENELAKFKADLESFKDTNLAQDAFDRKNAQIKSKESEITNKKKAIDAKKAQIAEAQLLVDAVEGTYGEYTDALPKDATTALDKVYEAYSSTYYYVNEIAKQLYNAKAAADASDEYLQILIDSGKHSDALIEEHRAVIEELKAIIVDFDATLEEAIGYADDTYDLVIKLEALTEYIETANKEPLKPYELPTFTDEDLEIPEDDETTDGEETEGEETEGEETEGEDTEGEDTTEPEEEEDDNGYPYTKYTSDENKIVLVTYENGTSFILNFNNYAVTTVINGVSYTVDGYSYVIFKN